MKVALITGHASGIGNHTIRQLHHRGFTVTGLDFHTDETLDKSIRQIRCDLCDEAQVSVAFNQLQNLDYAINCAGISGVRKPVSELTTTDLMDSFHAIFMPAFYAVQ